MPLFTISKPGSSAVMTDCPQIAVQFGGRLMRDEHERKTLEEILQPHLDVQTALRMLLQNGQSVLSDTPDAEDIRQRIHAISKKTFERSIGVCKVIFNTKR